MNRYGSERTTPAQASEKQGKPGLATQETAEPEPAGTIEGLVTFHGEVPKSPVPDDAGVRRPLLEVDPTTHGLRFVVAWLMPVTRSADELATAAGTTPQTAPPVTVDQRDHAFTPCLVAVRAGQPVSFTNSDPANHNVRTASPIARNVFNVFTGMDGKYQHRFVADPELRPVRLGCDIHPWMRGWIYVFDHPHFAVSDEQGRFRMVNVPPGRYRLLLRQPDIRYSVERAVSVSAGQIAKFEIEVQAENPSKPER